MKKLLFLLIALSAFLLRANTISESRAKALANSILNLQSGSHCISGLEVLRSEQGDLAYIYALEPTGYMVISAHDTLPPLVAYSVDSDFGFRNTDNPLRTILKADLSHRLQFYDVSYTDTWQRAETSPRSITLVNDYLLSTNWNQTAPWTPCARLTPYPIPAA
ncbi:MAG: Spi family protease inhibitor [Candidatus Cloacimonadaceae bacterium]